MRKEFLQAEAQVELLRSRGVACDAATETILMREGYYAVVNGYGKPFLDAAATRAAGEDRYLPSTSFAHLHTLFSLDRDLRMLVFGQLMRVEGTLRAITAAAFLEEHPDDAYLREDSYTDARRYLLGEEAHRKDLHNMVRTMVRFANEHEDDERGRDDARLAHYRKNYDVVPLWVVFSDFTYGNLYHFLALMQAEDQARACQRLARVLSGDEPRKQMTRRALVADVAQQMEVRNICAHGERLYDAVRLDKFCDMMDRYLPDDEAAAFRSQMGELVAGCLGISPVLDAELARAGLRNVKRG